jgi:hypothetical protein
MAAPTTEAQAQEPGGVFVDGAHSARNFVQEDLLALSTQRTTSLAWLLRGTMEIPLIFY